METHLHILVAILSAMLESKDLSHNIPLPVAANLPVVGTTIEKSMKVSSYQCSKISGFVLAMTALSSKLECCYLTILIGRHHQL